MSQSWIKVETITPGKIEIARVAKLLAMDRHAVLGRLILIWSYWDQHATGDPDSANGRINGIDAAFVDAMVGHPGFCAALSSVGWMTIEAGGISLPNFDRHNGGGAKSRLLAARRNEHYRERKTKRNKSDAPRDARPSRAPSPEKKREEQKREDQNSPKRGTPGGQGDLPFPETPEPAPEKFDESTALAQEFAFLGGEGTSMPAIKRAKVVIEDILTAGITPDTIRAELRREGRTRSEHPGRMRDRLTPRERTNGHRSRPDAGDYDPNREDPSAARPYDDNGRSGVG